MTKIKILHALLLSILTTSFFSCHKGIPMENLNMKAELVNGKYSKPVLENEIPGVYTNHEILANGLQEYVEVSPDHKTVYLFTKGHGSLQTQDSTYTIVPETIFLPNAVQGVSFEPNDNDTLHFLKIMVFQTELDKADIKTFPKENTENIYFKKFTDCESYTEPIKSPQTTSRTILPNKIIPRVAMGTVETIGPDKVGAHEHPMLEQLFLGLADNQTIVYADDAQIDFPEHSLLHIPLGSSHSVEVKKNNKMYYVWMDFFRDKAGEEWLKTHETEDNK